MTKLETGRAYFDKAAERYVIFDGPHWVVGVGYHTTRNFIENPAEALEPVVRQCHYDALDKTNRAFLDALMDLQGRALTLFAGQFGNGYRAAVTDLVAALIRAT